MSPYGRQKIIIVLEAAKILGMQIRRKVKVSQRPMKEDGEIGVPLSLVDNSTSPKNDDSSAVGLRRVSNDMVLEKVSLYSLSLFMMVVLGRWRHCWFP